MCWEISACKNRSGTVCRFVWVFARAKISRAMFLFAVFLLKQTLFRKNPRAHKNKIGTSPPPAKPKIPPPNPKFYGHGFSCRTDAFFQASIKLAQPFPAAELRTKIYGHEDFSELCSYPYRPNLSAYSFWGGGVPQVKRVETICPDIQTCQGDLKEFLANSGRFFKTPSWSPP